MKRIFILIIAVVFCVSFLVADTDGDKKFFLSVNGNLLSPADDGYKDVYGSSLIFPGFEGGFKLSKSLYIKAGMHFLSKEGKTPVLDETAKSTQSIISLGAGYWGSFSDTFGYRAEAGISSFSFKEEAFGEVVDGSKVGFFLNGGLTYKVGDSFFVSFLLGYYSASADVSGVDIKLGGFNTALGFGIVF